MPLHNVPMKAPASDSGSEYDFLEDEDSENPNVFRIEGALPRPVKRDFTIEELHSMVHNGDIDTEPPYQRDVVWTGAKMTGLIDSIWKNYHIPSLVFVSKEDSDGDETLVCVDGKQRLTSILKFMDGTIPHKINTHSWWWTCPGKVKANHGQIPDHRKRDFCARTISCDVYHNLSEEAEREMFRRVQMGVVLTTAEKLRVVNSPMATFLNDMESQHIHIAGGLGELLTWDLKRGKPYQNLMVMVYYCHNYPDERLNNHVQLEKWLHSDTAPSVVFKEDIGKVLRDMWKIASDDNLSDPFTFINHILSPVEFVFIGVLLYAIRDSDLRTKSSAIKAMRQYVRANHEDIRLNNKVIKPLWGIVKRLEKNPRADISTKAGTGRPRGRPPGSKNLKRKVDPKDDDGDYVNGRATRRR